MFELDFIVHLLRDVCQSGRMIQMKTEGVALYGMVQHISGN
jgi:hypothetical protein